MLSGSNVLVLNVDKMIFFLLKLHGRTKWFAVVLLMKGKPCYSQGSLFLVS